MSLAGLLGLGLLAVSTCAQTPPSASNSQVPAPGTQNYARLPLGFEKQAAGSGERFVARGQGYAIGLERGRATIGVVKPDKTRHVVSLEFAGSRPSQAIPGPELPGKINYIRSNDPRKWQLALASYERVTYPDTYPGIDVVYYGNQQQLEFDLVVKPGANPDSIRLKVEGADKLSIDGSGALVLGHAAGDLRVALPQIYQEVNGEKKNVPGHYTLAGRDEVAFRVEPWDHTRPLVIDPTIVYSALLGGIYSSVNSSAIALDSNGNILIAGQTYDLDFPTVNAFQNSIKGYSSSNFQGDAFVTKINPAGTALIYSTYLGGSSYDYAQGIAVDSTGAAWVTGQTQSTDFPVVNAAQPTYGGSTDAFVARFNSAGVLQFSTYLGGNFFDQGTGIAVDGSNNGYVTGYTNSGNFPTTAGVVNTSNPSQDGYAVKYSPAGAVLYSTFLGGAQCCTYGRGIAVDSGGDAYVTGSTDAITFTGAPGGGAQTTNNGFRDAFVAKLNSNATALLYFTFLGGTAFDQGGAIAVDSSGHAFIAGQTYSTGLATANAAQTALAGVFNGFAAELNPSGSAFTYVTYLGGNRTNYLTGLALDGSGNVYMAGYTDSTNFPTVAAIQPTLPINGVSLFNSTDSGASFAAFDSNIPGGAASQISINPAGTSAVVLTEGGIYRTVNGGGLWTQQFSGSFYGSSYIARSPVATGTIYAFQCCGTLYKSTDDGVTWGFVSNPSVSGFAYGILADPLSAATVYLFGYGGSSSSFNSPYVSISVNGGSTFSPATTGLPAAAILTMVATTDGALYAGTDGFGIYKSTNQGASWAAANTGLPAMAFAQPNSLSASGTTVYFAASGNIYMTTNGGASWAAASSDFIEATSIAASPQNALVLYAVTFSDTVVQSSDGGATWSSPATGLPSNLTADSFFGTQLVVDPGNSAHVLLVVQIQQTGWVAKLNSTGSALTYSTYLGGNGNVYTSITGVATDGAGNAFVTGPTSASSGFPVTSTALPSGDSGSFITKISDATAACSAVTVSPASASASQYGGPLTFSVVAPSGCAYTASTNQAFAVVTSGASGNGVGTVTVELTPQVGTTTNTATLTVGATTVPITLPGESCTYSLDMPSYSVPAVGGTVTAILTATAGCPYAVTNNYSTRVTVTSGASGSGSGTINLTVAPNPYTLPMTYFLSVGVTGIQITQPSAQLAVSTTSVPGGAVGAYYATALAATGGTPPYSNWTVASGSLPPGLTLNFATGVISGIPTTQVGSPFNFSITVQDSVPTTSAAQSLTIGIGPFATFPGQNELLTGPRSTSAQPLLLPFVTNLGLFDTQITIANTSQDTIGTTVQSGTCMISFYGVGAPTPNTNIAVPGGTLVGGTTTTFPLSSIAPAFQGYAAVSCTFPLARGSARIVYNAGQPTGVTVSEAAQVLTVPRYVPSSQNLLLPFVSNQAGFDTGIVIANTSTDPFGANGATPTSGSCLLDFYGSGAPSPNTGVAIPGGNQILASGTTTSFLLSAVAPGFQGYMIMECNFGGAAAFAFPADNFNQPGGYEVSETPESISFPRSSTPQPLLFSNVTNQNGNDTGIAIANTSTDPFGVSGAAPASGTCTLNFYGSSAPASPFVTPFIASGSVYTTTISSIAPAFQGYVTATCPFGPARGLTFVIGSVGANNYTESSEVVPIPRSAATPSTLLFSNTTNVGGLDTTITIANTSQDSFGTTPASGICTINFSNGPASQNSPTIGPGGSYSFLLSQLAPGFQGYVVASCTFPQARGVAEINTPAVLPVITTTALPGGTVGVAYSQPLAATSGVPPYQNWTVVSGALPPGLGLNAATGVIAGTPTTATGSPFTFSVTVQDSANNTSAAQSLSIAIMPSGTPMITSVSPSSAAAGSPAFTLTVSGSNFVNGSTVQFNGTALSTTFGNATQLTATVTANLLATPGTFGVTVVNPGGSTSNAATFTITAPTLSSLSPSSAAAGSPAFTLTVSGTNFVNGSTVQFNGTALSTTFGNATQLTATVTANLLGTVGTVGVTVVSPGGSTTNAATFTIVGPTLSSVSPSSTAAGSPAFTLAVSGTNFVNGSAVQFNGTALSTSFGNATQLTATVTANLLGTVGTVGVTVVNPGGATTNAATFTILAPTVSSVSPSSTAAGSPAFTPVVSGTNFVNGSTVEFNGTALSTTFGNATQLTATVTANLLGTVGTVGVTVVNPGGAATNAATFTILAPAISSLNPSSAPPGSPAFTLTVNGTNFVNGSAVQFNGTALSTTFGNATQLTATVTANLLITGGTVSVTVVNPGGSTTNAATFAIASQTISFDALPGRILGISPFPIAAQSSALLPVTFASTTSAVCTTADDLVTLLRAGTCTITASQSSGTATPVTRSFTVSQANPSATLTAAANSPFTVGAAPNSVVVGDFNGDGIPDLATANPNGGSVSVLLGNGVGGFTAPSGSPFNAGPDPQSLAVGDFNGDGIQDLAIANYSEGFVTVLLGDGSGGFTQATGGPTTVGSDPRSIVVGDFNGDGIQDLATANYGSNSVTVLLGNGSGGFTAAPGGTFRTDSNPYSVVVGDFNGDGIQDLAIANYGDDDVTVLLGNGSGGFTSAPGSAFEVGTQPFSVVVGDFNGDGIQDLATANFGSNNVTVLLGSGSGGFSQAPSSPITVGLEPSFVAVGDFNGDGIPDLAVANYQFPGGLTVLLGNGSGGFSQFAGSPFAIGPNLISMAVGDFNGDGRTDIAIANTGNSNNLIVLLGSAGSLPSITTNSLPAGTVGAAYSQTLAAANGVAPYMNWTVASGSLPPGLTLNAATGVIAGTPTTAAGSPFNFTVTVQDSANNTSGPQGFSLVIVAAATPVISGVSNGGDNSPPPLAPGSLAFMFGTNLASTQASANTVPAPFNLGGVSILVNGTPAAILFVSPNQINFQIPYEIAVGNATITVTNSGSASAGFQFTVVAGAPGPMFIQNTNTSLNNAANPIAPGATAIVFFTGLGATNPAVADGAGAPTSPLAQPVASSSVSVGGLTASVQFIGLAPGLVGQAQANFVVPAGLLAGSYPLIVTVNGRPSQAVTVYISGAAPSVTSVTPNTVPPGSAATPITISGANFGGGSTVSFTRSGGSPSLIVPTMIQAAQIMATIPVTFLTTAGPAQIAVSNGLGTVSNSVPFTITSLTSQIITFTPLNNVSLGVAPFTISATASSGLTVSFASNSLSVCTVNVATVTILSAGTCSITASQPGNGTYAAATPVTQTFIVSSLNLPLGPSLGNYAPGPNQLQIPLSATGGTPPYHYSITPGTPAILGLRVQDGQPLPVNNTSFPPSITAGILALLAPGSYSTSIRVTDLTGATFDRAVNFNVLPIDIVSFQGGLPKAIVNTPYSFQFTPYGGSGTYTWSGPFAGATGPPPGLTLNSSTGVLSGTPLSAGTFSFSVSLADAAGGPSISRGETLTVSPFAITDSPILPPATAGSPYSHQFSAPNCGAGCTGTVYQSVLPPGFSFSSGGLLTGTFTNAAGGEYSFSLQGSGAGGTTQKRFTLLILPTVSQPLAITNNIGQTSLPLGVNSATPLVATGGTPPYTFTLLSGSLPPGMALKGPGETIGDLQPGYTYLAGWPEVANTYNFTIQATDSAGNTATRAFSVLVSIMEILYSSLPIAGNPLIYNTPYSQQLLVVGGNGNYTSWTAAPTPIYPGLSLNAQTGLITGTPTITGFNFPALTVTDSAANTVTSFVGINAASLNQSQTISFTPLGSQTLASLPPPLSATASSGLTVTFTSNSLSVCTVSGVNVTLLTVGTCSITASQPGDPTYGPATPVTQTFSISTFVPLTLSVSPGSISTVTGGSVSAGFSASGGTGSYTYSVSGQPAGVTSSGASLSGSPTQAGVFNVAVTVTDSSQTTASAALTINVLGLTTTSLPNGTTGQLYATSIGAAGGTGTFTFSATGLPAGLSLANYGYLSGTVKTAGTFPIGVTVSSGGLSATTTLSLTIANAAPLSISSATLPAGTVKVFYSQALSATGGVPPYTWSVVSGALPQGLSLNAEGIVSGTPTTDGSFMFGVQATDTAGATARAAATLTIQPAPLIITTQTLPSGMMGVDYPQQQLAVVGGVSPYTWTLASGSTLPMGMMLSTSGILSGVPGAAGPFSLNVTVTDSAKTPGSMTFPLTIRAPSPDLILTSSTLSFALASPASSAPPSQMVGVQSTVPSQPIAYTVSVSPAAPWLALTNGTTTPDSITVALTAAALSLSPGPYQTTITATCTSNACNNHTQTVTVNLTVTATPSQLVITTGLLSFATTSAALGALSQPINVQNAGGGSLGFASLSCEAPWCTVGNAPASVGGGVTAALAVTVDPSVLSPGFYRTQVDIATSGGIGSVPVTLFISANATATLAPEGTLFNTPAGSSPGNSNGSFLVSVNSPTPVSFSAAVITGANFLNLQTTSGSASSTQPGVVSFSLNTAAVAALAPGAYYGQIQVTSSQLSNSPETFEVVLNVAAANSPVAPDPEPGGLLFITTAGGVLPPQTVTVYSGSVAPLTFQASAASAAAGGSGGWLSVTPATGTASATSPGVTTVSVNTTGLKPGVYIGGVNYSLSATAIRRVTVTLIVSPAGGTSSTSAASVFSENVAPNSPRANGCTPSVLVPAQTGLVNSFAQPAGWPTPLQIVLANDCGATVNNGQVVAQFSNGDPPLALALADPSRGLYAGTWSPAKPSSQVTINITANAPGFPAATSKIAGAVAPNAVPLLAPNSTLHVFDSLIGGALAPGTIVAIYGQNLASMMAQPTTIPLPSTFNGTQVIVGGKQAPLYFVSPGQVNAQIPFELQPGNQYQVIISANGALTTPQPVQLSSATPGLAAFPDTTLIAQHSDGSLVSQTSPAKAGEYLVAYLAGLGDTNVPVTSGTASPSSPLAMPSNTVTLTINGTPEPLLFAGLTPGLVGLYQMNFQVPAGLPAGNITIMVSQNGQASNQTTLPYQP